MKPCEDSHLQGDISAFRVQLLAHGVIGEGWTLGRVKKGNEEKVIDTRISDCDIQWEGTGRKVLSASTKQ